MAGEGPHEVDSQLPLPEGEVADAVTSRQKIRSQDGGIPNEENSSHLFFRGFGLLQGCLQVSRYSPLLLQIVTLQAECGTPQHRTIMQMTAVSSGM